MCWRVYLFGCFFRKEPALISLAIFSTCFRRLNAFCFLLGGSRIVLLFERLGFVSKNSKILLRPGHRFTVDSLSYGASWGTWPRYDARKASASGLIGLKLDLLA